MSLASTAGADLTGTAGAGRGRLRAVAGPTHRPGDASPAAPTGEALPPLRLRALPQARPQAWDPGTGAATGGSRGPGTEPWERAGHQQQVLVLHGLPCAVMEPDPTEPAATAVADLPCPEQLARQLVQAAVDVVRGHRPASQVLRWTTPEVYSQLRQRARLEQAAGRTGGRRPVVRSLRTSRCGERGVEVSAVVLDGNRARAVAARLDGEESRWRLTALVIG